MSRATGPEAVRTGKEVLLIHRLQHHDDCSLRQLIFEGRDVGGIMHLMQLALGIIDGDELNWRPNDGGVVPIRRRW
jgi:hypothetical protein